MQQTVTRKRQTTRKGGTQSHWPTSRMLGIWSQGCRAHGVLLWRGAGVRLLQGRRYSDACTTHVCHPSFLSFLSSTHTRARSAHAMRFGFHASSPHPLGLCCPNHLDLE